MQVTVPMLILVAVCSGIAAPVRSSVAQTVQATPSVVAQIRRADYEGDRMALRSLASELQTTFADGRMAARALYWKGFALWRRSINGFNEDQPERAALEQDLLGAAESFREAARSDPGFHDAEIGLYSCLSLLGFLHRGEPERLTPIAAELRTLANVLKTTAADNPRWIWVVGQNEFVALPGTNPEQLETRRARVIANYERGLDLARQQRPVSADSLEPSWGEAELLMSLAWSRLNQAAPDPSAAERHAKAALALVPNWHYVRDILMPQIARAARPK